MARTTLILVFIVLSLGTAVWCKPDFSDFPSVDKHKASDELIDGAEEIGRSGTSANSGGQDGGRFRSGPTPVRRPLECYVCTDCPTVLPNTTTKLCPMTTDQSRNKCVVFAEQYNHMKRPWYIRGCASERGVCNDISNSHSSHQDIVKLSYCNECDSERCNTSGVSLSLPNSVMGILALVVTPLVAKYTLS